MYSNLGLFSCEKSLVRSTLEVQHDSLQTLMTGKKLISLFGPMYLLKKAVLDECSEKYPRLKSELNEVLPRSERGLKTFLAVNVID